MNSTRRRVAPPTRDHAGRARRVAELREILRLRGPAFDRSKMTPAEVAAIAETPYGRAAGAYIATHDDYAWKVVDQTDARHVPPRDVLQAARLGLFLALDRFDQKRLDDGAVTAFLSYARWWVRCEVGKLLEREGLVHVPSTTRKAAALLRDAMQRLANERGCYPEMLSDADALIAWRKFAPRAKGKDKPPIMRRGRVAELRTVYLGHEHLEVSTTASTGDSEGRDYASANSEPVLEAMKRDEEAASDRRLRLGRDAVLGEAVAALPPKQRRLVAEKFGCDLDAEAATAELPACPRRLSELLKAAFARVRDFVAGFEARLGVDLELAPQ